MSGVKGRDEMKKGGRERIKTKETDSLKLENANKTKEIDSLKQEFSNLKLENVDKTKEIDCLKKQDNKKPKKSNLVKKILYPKISTFKGQKVTLDQFKLSFTIREDYKTTAIEDYGVSLEKIELVDERNGLVQANTNL
ncbi:hypothetical protein ACTFIW_009875 [Dictyostelium discoideum]